MAEDKETKQKSQASSKASGSKTPEKKQAAAPKKAPAKKPASRAAKSEAKPKTEAKPKAKAATTKSAATKAAAGSKTEAKPKTSAKRETGAKERAEAKPKPAPKPKEAAKPPVVNARARFVRVAPRKARLVANQVRGLHVDDAKTLLRFSNRGAARDIAKLIDSATANAEANHDLVADDLMVADITVDEGPTLRRYRPRALGRATRINKRTSHIKVALTPEELD
jgi:ribosomal protein L22